MNHAEYQKNMKNKSVPELMYIIKDATEAMNLNPDNPKNGYYQDEVHYAAAELRKRQKI